MDTPLVIFVCIWFLWIIVNWLNGSDWTPISRANWEEEEEEVEKEEEKEEEEEDEVEEEVWVLIIYIES